MERQDQIECWLQLKGRPHTLNDAYHLGCLHCSQGSPVFYIHKDDPKLCRCHVPYECTQWINNCFATVMWPTCERCFLEWFDVQSIKVNENIRFIYSTYIARDAIVTNKMPKHRNAKKAYQ